MSRTRHHHHRQFSVSKSPGWWHHICLEKPARVAARALARLAVKTADLDEVDAVKWPIPDKPHIYFW